jgi:hypothetical protein
MVSVFLIFHGPDEHKQDPVYFAAILTDTHVIEGLQYLGGYKYRVVSKHGMSIPFERCLPVSEIEFYSRLDRRANTIRHFVEVYRHYLAQIGSAN